MQKVVYSTCSVHQEENEIVVFDTLKKDGIAEIWDIARREKVLPDWPLRGQLPSDDADAVLQEQAEGLIRCERRLGTHGFFVAVFVRRGPTEAAPAFPKKADGDQDSRSDTQAVGPPIIAPAAQSMEESHRGGKVDRLNLVLPRAGDTDFLLLRLATLDRKRRRGQELIRLARKAARYD